MKKIFTLCAAVLMSGAAAMAQVDNTFQFVDKDGNVIADGSTWHTYERVEEDIFIGPQILSGVYVKNMTATGNYCSIDYQITETPGGIFQICFPEVCTATKGTSDIKNTGTGYLEPNQAYDIETEWCVAPFPQDEVKGTCTATFQLKTMEQIIDDKDNDDPDDDEISYNFIANGPKITVVFHNDGTTQGIDGVSDAEGKQPVAYYSLDGRRLPVAQKGLNIVKYSDGSTRKVVVK